METKHTRRSVLVLVAAASVVLAACSTVHKPAPPPPHRPAPSLQYASGPPEPLVGIPLGQDTYVADLAGALIAVAPAYTHLSCSAAQALLPQRALVLWHYTQRALTASPTPAFLRSTYLPMVTSQGKAALLGSGAPSLRALVTDLYDAQAHGGPAIPCPYVTLSGAMSIIEYALATGMVAPGHTTVTAQDIAHYVTSRVLAASSITLHATIHKTSYGLDAIQITQHTPGGTFRGNDYAAQYGGRWFLIYVGVPLY